MKPIRYRGCIRRCLLYRSCSIGPFIRIEYRIQICIRSGRIAGQLADAGVRALTMVEETFKTIEEMGEEILEHVIQVASGEIQSKADALGQDDFIPWKRGVSL